ncbi:metal ABC transporter ATP-binding protein [Shouchella sp. 1P09AA]|uniref:metal ABC transporter ATP-binding protein n=1 Tax=unclassified Shouchella TaxID=2893065 RepID=UPI0039A3964C
MVNGIAVENLYVSYHGNEALHDVSFTTNYGCIIGVIGPNGAGKSTLLKSILNLQTIDKGTIKINGNSISKIRKKIAYVPQRSSIDWDFPITVIDTVLMGSFPNLSLFRRPQKEHRQWALECLKQVRMEDFKNRQISELSGGQQQRIFVARALAQNPDLFFLDEPFVGIDVTSEELIINILRKQRDLGKTILIVHHDLSKAMEYFDEVLLLNKELIKFGSPREVCRPEVMKKAYQGQLSFLEGAE